VEEREPDDVAAMIYSSGLTGYPMGAMLTQGNLDHQSDLLRLCMDADDTDTTLTLIPCFHSFSISTNLLSMIRYGGTAYLMKKLDFKELHYALSEGGVTSICAVPTLFYGMVFHPDLSDIDYTHMRSLIAGGSALSMEVFQAFKDRFHTELCQGYGITEASPVCSVNNRHVENRPASIGLPVPGVEARVADDEGRTVGPLETGELLFRGPNIMKGYYKKEKETREIVRDGWLYTGDLAYKDDEGFIFFADRAKDLIIRGGENIFPAEIEDALRKHPKVMDVAVLGYPHPRLVEIVMAIIQPKEGETIVDEEIINFVKEKGLAKYKWPEKMVYTTIPRNPAGKIEKPKLRDMYVKPAKEAMEKEFKKQ